MTGPYDYGLWWLVAFHVAIFVFFALSFLRPRTRREWRSMGAFAAFLVALYTEMYGFPLTIYLLTAWLSRFPVAEPFAHASGNLWASLALGGWGGGLFMGLGGVLILSGVVLMSNGWQAIYEARGGLVAERIYAKVRHPQYAGLALVVIGALIQWPTLLTLVMTPVLLVSYVRLAVREERELEARLGETYRAYREQVPAFIPRWRSSTVREGIVPPVRFGDRNRPESGA